METTPKLTSGQWFNSPLPGRLSDVFGLKTNAFYDFLNSLRPRSLRDSRIPQTIPLLSQSTSSAKETTDAAVRAAAWLSTARRAGCACLYRALGVERQRGQCGDGNAAHDIDARVLGPALPPAGRRL